MRKFLYLLLATTVFAASRSACSNSKNDEAKTPEQAINHLINAYADNDLERIRGSLGSNHRFGNNIVEGLEWIGNCLKVMKQCIKTPIQVVETKTVGSEIAVAVMAKNLMGAPMSVWFVTNLENGSYKVTGMNTRYECVFKTQEQKANDLEKRKPGDYTFCQ